MFAVSAVTANGPVAEGQVVLSEVGEPRCRSKMWSRRAGARDFFASYVPTSYIKHSLWLAGIAARIAGGTGSPGMSPGSVASREAAASRLKVVLGRASFSRTGEGRNSRAAKLASGQSGRRVKGRRGYTMWWASSVLRGRLARRSPVIMAS